MLCRHQHPSTSPPRRTYVTVGGVRADAKRVEHVAVVCARSQGGSWKGASEDCRHRCCAPIHIQVLHTFVGDTSSLCYSELSNHTICRDTYWLPKSRDESDVPYDGSFETAPPSTWNFISPGKSTLYLNRCTDFVSLCTRGAGAGYVLKRQSSSLALAAGCTYERRLDMDVDVRVVVGVRVAGTARVREVVVAVSARVSRHATVQDALLMPDGL